MSIKNLLIKINTVGCDKETKKNLLVLLDELFEKEYPHLIDEPESLIVNQPSHYMSEHGKETIVEIFEDILCEEKDLFNAVATSNCWKYCSRYQKKNGSEDLKKAKKYAEFLKLTTLRKFN